MNVSELPTGAVLEIGDLCGLFIAYQADGYRLTGGIAGIIESGSSIEPGILMFQGEVDGDGKGCFMVASEQNARGPIEKGKVYMPDEDHPRRRELFEQAFTQMNSTPQFYHCNPSQVSGNPNFMQRENWKDIAELIASAMDKVS